MADTKISAEATSGAITDADLFGGVQSAVNVKFLFSAVKTWIKSWVFAVQSDQETATSNAVAVTPGTQKFHPGSAKAWAYVTVSGGVYSIIASYNVTSVTKTATGDVTVNFTVPFSSGNYALSLVCINGSVVTLTNTGAPAAGSLRCNFFNLSAALIDASFAVVCYGDQ